VWIAGEKATPEAAVQAAQVAVWLEFSFRFHRAGAWENAERIDRGDGEILELRRRMFYSLELAIT
jgi:hypothetical protein